MSVRQVLDVKRGNSGEEREKGRQNGNIKEIAPERLLQTREKYIFTKM